MKLPLFTFASLQDDLIAATIADLGGEANFESQSAWSSFVFAARDPYCFGTCSRGERPRPICNGEKSSQSISQALAPARGAPRRHRGRDRRVESERLAH